MKKSAGISFFLLTAVFISACANEGTNTSPEEDPSASADNNEEEEISFDADELNEENAQEDENEDNDEDEEAAEIVEQAIEADAEREAYYMHMETSTGDSEETVEEEFWFFPQDDDDAFRRESRTSDGTEEYAVKQDGETQFYTAGDDTVHVLETEDMDESEDTSTLAYYFETFELQYIGEEEVNGFETYHVEFTDEEETLEQWFTQEDFFSVRSLRTVEREDAEETTEMNVLDYELNPEQDNELLQLDDVLDDDVSYEDIDDEEFFDGETDTQDEEDVEEDHG